MLLLVLDLIWLNLIIFYLHLKCISFKSRNYKSDALLLYLVHYSDLFLPVSAALVARWTTLTLHLPKVLSPDLTNPLCVFLCVLPLFRFCDAPSVRTKALAPFPRRAHKHRKRRHPKLPLTFCRVKKEMDFLTFPERRREENEEVDAVWD